MGKSGMRSLDSTHKSLQEPREKQLSYSFCKRAKKSCEPYLCQSGYAVLDPTHKSWSFLGFIDDGLDRCCSCLFWRYPCSDLTMFSKFDLISFSSNPSQGSLMNILGIITKKKSHKYIVRMSIQF